MGEVRALSTKPPMARSLFIFRQTSPRMLRRSRIGFQFQQMANFLSQLACTGRPMRSSRTSGLCHRLRDVEGASSGGLWPVTCVAASRWHCKVQTLKMPMLSQKDQKLRTDFLLRSMCIELERGSMHPLCLVGLVSIQLFRYRKDCVTLRLSLV